MDLNNPGWIFIDFRRFQDQKVRVSQPACGIAVASHSCRSPTPTTTSMQARDLQTTSQRTCRLPATRFGVLAGWMANDLRELRGVRLVAEGWLAGDVVSHARRSERSADNRKGDKYGSMDTFDMYMHMFSLCWPPHHHQQWNP